MRGTAGVHNFQTVTANPSILVGTANRTVWVRVEGKGTFLNSTGLKEFSKEMINRGHREFVVDLRNCPLMDSTFMGTLAAIGLALRGLGQGELRAINLNERNRDLLTNLGLDQLFTLGGNEEPPEAGASGRMVPHTPLEGEPADKLTQTRTMLEAHEACVKADGANAAKFKDVIEYLKQDLHLVR